MRPQTAEADLGDRFRAVMGRYPAAVCVITAREHDEVAAMTATAVMSFTATPPSVLCSIASSANSHLLLTRCKRFAVSVLSADQGDAARAFARSNVAKFEREELVQVDGLEMPVMRGSLATLVCDREAVYDHFDHSLLIGRVTDATYDSRAASLIYADRRFWTLVESELRPAR